MKSIITQLIVVLSLVAVNITANATSLKPEYLSADLIDIQLDPNLYYPNTPAGGHIIVDEIGGKISLTVFGKYHCPKGLYCTAVMPAPLRVELPLVSIEQNECGDIVYTAQRDSRPADGSLQVLTVTDNTEFSCPTFAILPATQIYYETVSAGFNPEHTIHKTLSSMTAHPLQFLE